MRDESMGAFIFNRIQYFILGALFGYSLAQWH